MSDYLIYLTINEINFWNNAFYHQIVCIINEEILYMILLS